MFERLWAGWRSEYLEGLEPGPPKRSEPARPGQAAATDVAVDADVAVDDAVEDGGGSSDGPDGHGPSLFEAILASGRPDDETFIVWRGERCFALLNLYPYTSGHVLVLPKQAARHLEELEADTAAELWRTVQHAVVALKAVYHPDGINVGANLGAAAGAGIPEHLHVHVLPRWFGDTNFTTTLAGTRVMPESLAVTWRKIVDAWPR